MMKSGDLLRTLSLWLGLGLVMTALSQTTTPEEITNDGMAAFGKMIPQGFVNADIQVPSFQNGQPSSLLTAATVTRLDDDRLSAENVVVEIYGQTPAENMRVDLKSAIYNMTEKVLRSGERSRVSRADFEMEGDSMVFNSATSVSSMKGRVRTLIFDTDTVSGQSKDNQPTN
ncbi:Lipopolysaccharide-assembly, LptC-related [Prosthecobacter debontii]|uniref:Lipopolysaccharide-assembly, LptC-related n=1 Tax=Prosthecobacter debontii TaxID=48467 RepID=A0A1T4YU90_9BACT|nr:LPS export ABC transporter periplasmic protein LptC [Prosthecobacter debontii]SKB04831.1 Lipopolysaccharide-assembly, LptC-related [Prosthecobacter debontii]